MKKNEKPWVNDLQIEPDEYRKWISQKDTSHSITYWALENGKIPSDPYLHWAREFYGLPSLNENFFSQRASKDFWNQIQDVYHWSPELIPLQEWDGVVYVACIEPHWEVEWSFPVQFILADHQHLKSYWSQLHSDLTGDHQIEIEEEEEIEVVGTEAIEMPGQQGTQYGASEELTQPLPSFEKHQELDTQFSEIETAVTQLTSPVDSTTPPEIVPHQKPEYPPTPTPEKIPTTIPEAEPQVVPETNPEPTPATAPDLVPETMPEVAPETTPQIIPETVPAPQITPEPAPETTPKTIPEQKADAAPLQGLNLASPPRGVDDSQNPANILHNGTPDQEAATVELSENPTEEPETPDGLNLNLNVPKAREAKEFSFDSLMLNSDKESPDATVPIDPTPPPPPEAIAQAHLKPNNGGDIAADHSVFESTEDVTGNIPGEGATDVKPIADVVHLGPAEAATEQKPLESEPEVNHLIHPTTEDFSEDGITEFTAVGINGMLDEAPDTIEQARTDGEVAAFYFKKLKDMFAKCMILLLEMDKVKPWKWDGEWPRVKVNEVEPVSLSQPSVFKIVHKTKTPFHGPVSSSPTNDLFFGQWGYMTPPEHVTICPLSYDGHMIGMVLCTGSLKAENLKSLQDTERVTDEIAIALQKLNRAA